MAELGRPHRACLASYEKPAFRPAYEGVWEGDDGMPSTFAGTAMNDEDLEPIGLPSQENHHGNEDARPTLRELVTQHPVAALAASAVVGAGVVALIAAATQRRDTSRLPAVIGNQAGEAYEELRSQLSKLMARLSDSLPSADAIGQTASDLGAQASKVIDKASDAAKHSFRRAAVAEQNIADAVATHPFVKSIALGAAGALITALTKTAQARREATAKTAVNGHDKDASAVHDSAV